MDMFHVKDVHGRIVVLYERTSILLTLAMLLAGAAAAAMLLGAASRLAEGAWAEAAWIMGGMVVTLIYVFVFNHLRRKGDMDTGSATLPSAQGRLVELRRVVSMWVTLAAALAWLLVILGLGAMGYGAYQYYQGRGGGILAVWGAAGLAAGLIYASVLGFLRAKLDFRGTRVMLRTVGGDLIELYKSRSLWLTLAMMTTLLLALMLLAFGALAVLGAAGHPRPGRLVAAEINAPRYEGGGLILAGLFLLINVAVLRFLSVKAHIRLVERASALSSGASEELGEEPQSAAGVDAWAS